jgi:hypothetical protein
MSLEAKTIKMKAMLSTAGSVPGKSSATCRPNPEADYASGCNKRASKLGAKTIDE